jgi:hypothetical protein
MGIPSDDPLSKRYRRVFRKDAGEFSLDNQMLSVFMELDGERALPEVAHRLGVRPETVAAAIAKLSRLQLVEPVKDALAPVDEAFMRDLITEFSLAIGPVADVVVEDAVLDLGHDLSSFPASRSAELVELLAEELQREGDKLTFKRNMLERIKRGGY